MTLWYVTTGISIREARCWKDARFPVHDDKPGGKLIDMPNGVDLIRAARARWEATANRVKGDPTSYATSAADAVKESFREKAWDPARLQALPAELATLLLLRGKIDPGDRIRLLFGDSNQIEAHVLAAMLAALARAGKLAGRGEADIRIELKGPYSWEPFDERSFDQGMAMLWADIDLPARFVLTAGFKAVLLWITNKLSLRPRTEDAAIEPIPIYYLHEMGPDLVSLEVDIEGAINASTAT